jgi:iron complex transport system substrate-binding protein
LPSLTENICALGQCARLVGVDSHSDYPASVKKLTQVGNGLNPSIEAIVALTPDLVVMDQNPRLQRRLSDFGITTLELSANSMAQLHYVLKKLDAALGVQKADGIWHTIKIDIKQAANTIPLASRGLLVYFELGSDGFTAGPHSFIGELLTSLDEKNIIRPNMGAFLQISPEFVVTSNPNIIMTSQENKESIQIRAGWSDIDAIKNKNICTFSQQQMDTFLRPSPRLANGAKIIAQCLIEQSNRSLDQSVPSKKSHFLVP